MRAYRAGTPLPVIADTQRALAARLPAFTGKPGEERIVECGRFFVPDLSAVCILTFDTGHHSSGWWKNPDYESCWHLSVSFRDAETDAFAPHDRRAAGELVRAFFGGAARLVWCEPPYSRLGKKAGAWHYRLFVDPVHRVPILPRGEVYSRRLTERGWKSFSELAAAEERARAGQRAEEPGR